MREEVTDTGPPEPEKGSPDRWRADPGRFQNISRDTVAASLDQLKAENLVRKYLANPIRYDRWIPSSLRTLDRAQRELCHDGLAIAISAAEWFATDLLIWRAYSPELARVECWRNIQIGLSWVQYLRRKGDRP